MPKYEQKLTFTKQFSCEAKNAEKANALLQDFIDAADFNADVEIDHHYDFEDEDVPCPVCDGNGENQEANGNYVDCKNCEGRGTIPFDGN